MLLASGHHRIMAAARGALVMMVLGKVGKESLFSTTDPSRQQPREAEQSQGKLASMLRLVVLV